MGCNDRTKEDENMKCPSDLAMRFTVVKGWANQKQSVATEAVSQEQEMVNPWRWKATARPKRKGGSAGS